MDTALEYLPAGGVVNVHVRELPGCPWSAGVELVVEDSAPGIAKDDRERMLGCFYRAPAAADSALVRGSGLGLATVESIARLHWAVVALDASPRLGGLRVAVRFAAAAGIPALQGGGARKAGAALDALRGARGPGACGLRGRGPADLRDGHAYRPPAPPPRRPWTGCWRSWPSRMRRWRCFWCSDRASSCAHSGAPPHAGGSTGIAGCRPAASVATVRATQLLAGLEVTPQVRNARTAFHGRGPQTLEARLATVGSARHSPDVCTFVFDDDELGRRLAAALQWTG